MAWINVHYQFLRARYLSDSSSGFVVGCGQDVGWACSHLKACLVLRDIHSSLFAEGFSLPGSWPKTSLSHLMDLSLGILEISHYMASPRAFILSGDSMASKRVKISSWGGGQKSDISMVSAFQRSVGHKQMYTVWVALKFYWRAIRKTISRRLLRWAVMKKRLRNTALEQVI